jgi:phosphate transport system substrate-binding protein
MIAIIFLAVFTGTCLVGCGGKEEARKVTGSDTMLNLTKNWSEAYQKEHPEVEINVNGGGSGTGIKALINGTTDFAMASRKIKEKERKACEEAGIKPVEHVVCYDGLAVIAHKDFPIKKITYAQLKMIYGDGNITSWKQVFPDGPDMEIVVFGRDSSSGTFEYFREAILGKKGTYRDKIQRRQGTAQIVDEVMKTRGGIGYVGMGYIEGKRGNLTVFKLQKEAGSTAYDPNDREYPLCRPLHFYTNGEPQGVIADFIKFALGEEGQKIVEKEGFIPKAKRE